MNKAYLDRVLKAGKALASASDDLGRIPCPECGNQNLLAVPAKPNVIVISCSALIQCDDAKYSIHECPFQQVVMNTTIDAGPFTFKFARQPRKKAVKKTT